MQIKKLQNSNIAWISYYDIHVNSKLKFNTRVWHPA